MIAKSFAIFYRILLLAALTTIAFYARLIYERMPLTYGDWVQARRANPSERAAALNREVIVKVPDTLTVDVDNEVQITGSVSIEQ
jgi:hypothetical protein